MKTSVTFAAILLFVAALASQLGGCSVLLEYEELPLGGGGTSAGGAGGQNGPACVAPSDCEEAADDNECRTTVCQENQCIVTFIPLGTPAGEQEPGDCKKNACDGAGKITSQNDDADAPMDGKKCTKDICLEGVPSNPPEDLGTACGADDALACDGNGNCTGCAHDDQCDDDTDCLNHYCEVSTTNCEVIKADDGLPCTDDGAFCNGVETCSNGSCESSGDPCPGPDGDDDCTESCNETSEACNAPDANGSFCDDGLFCNGADICLNDGVCTHDGDPCTETADGDLNCAESCNEENNSCNAPDPNGSPCTDDGTFCNGTESCMAGVCTSSGDPCNGPDGDNDCNESCNESANDCSASDANGSSCEDGIYCTGADTCQSGTCVGGPDPCPGPDNDADCSESCDESTETCTAVDIDGSTCLSDSTFCNGIEQCQAGACISPGNPCPGPDGDSNCSESCNESSKNCKAKDPNGASCSGGKSCFNGNCLTIHLPKDHNNLPSNNNN